MVIQGTQVPMYTNTHYFCIFFIFQFFIYFYEKQNKTKLKNKQTKTCKHTKYKTRFTQKQKAKQTSNAKT